VFILVWLWYVGTHLRSIDCFRSECSCLNNQVLEGYDQISIIQVIDGFVYVKRISGDFNYLTVILKYN